MSDSSLGRLVGHPAFLVLSGVALFASGFSLPVGAYLMWAYQHIGMIVTGSSFLAFLSIQLPYDVPEILLKVLGFVAVAGIMVWFYRGVWRYLVRSYRRLRGG